MTRSSSLHFSLTVRLTRTCGCGDAVVVAEIPKVALLRASNASRPRHRRNGRCIRISAQSSKPHYRSWNQRYSPTPGGGLSWVLWMGVKTWWQMHGTHIPLRHENAPGASLDLHML